jgi:hypothetical protein
MKTYTYISLFLLALLSPACSDSDSDNKKPDEDDVRLVTKEETIPVDTAGAGTPSNEPPTSNTQLTGLVEDLLALTPTLTLVGTLTPPSVNGAVLQASDITVKSSKVYVAYNTAGDSLAGGIDVIDISTPASPVLASHAVYSDIDINKVTVNGTNLYATGATSSGDGGAILTKISLDGSGNLTSTQASVALRAAGSATTSAYAGTSVIASAATVYALSGNNGGLSILNASDLSQKSFTAIEEARDISFDSSSSSLYIVSGKTASTNAQVKHYNLTSGAALSDYTVALPNAQIDAGKSTIITGSNMQLTTAGFGGSRLLCLSNGATLGTAANPSIPGLTPADQVANAAAFGNGLMYVANGGAGVSIYSVNTPLIPLGCLGITINYLGRFSLGDDASVNNIFYSNGHLVVATGTKGFKIVKVTQSVLAQLLNAL